MLKWNASKASRQKIKLNCGERIVIIECERSELKKSKNWSVASEASGKFFENFALFPPILASLGQIIYFVSRIGQIIYFQYFEGQNIYFQKVPAPPPSESNGRPLNAFDFVVNCLINFTSRTIRTCIAFDVNKHNL